MKFNSSYSANDTIGIFLGRLKVYKLDLFIYLFSLNYVDNISNSLKESKLCCNVGSNSVNNL